MTAPDRASPRGRTGLLVALGLVGVVALLLGTRVAIKAGTGVVKSNEISLKEFRLHREELWDRAQAGGPEIVDLNGYVRVDDTATRLFSGLFKCPTDHFLSFKESEEDASTEAILICPTFIAAARRVDVVNAYGDQWGRAHVKLMLKTSKAALMVSTPLVDVAALDLEWK